MHVDKRSTETVTIDIPIDTLEMLKKVAASRDMSYHALLRLYIGQGFGKTPLSCMQIGSWK